MAKITVDNKKFRQKKDKIELEVTKMSAELLSELRDKNWTTRTGRAEQGLNVVPFAADDNAGLIFGGIVPYQSWLESWSPHIGPTGEDFVEIFKKRIVEVLNS